VEYSKIASTYEQMDITSKRILLTNYLAELFKSTPVKIIDKVVYLTQGKLYPDFEGIEIGIADKLVIRVLSDISGLSKNKIDDLYKKLGDIGLVAQKLLKKKQQTTLFSQPLTFERVYTTLEKIAKTAGVGSLDFRLNYLRSLLNDASPEESKHILRMVTGRLRLGIADYTVLDALSIAFTDDKNNRIFLEKAYNLTSDLGKVAKTVALLGLDGIKKIKIKVGNPIRPMLAERLETPKQILEKLGGSCAVEYKLDGERIQVHKKDQKVNLFSRRLENITKHYPDAIKLVRDYVKAKNGIFEGEIVVINEDTGEYLAFQDIMHRRRKHGIKKAMQQYPIALNFFDVLFADKVDYTSKPYFKRRPVLLENIQQHDGIKIIRSIVADKVNLIENFMQQAISDGCEGLVAKDLNSVYRAGAREFAWIKLKREYNSELNDTIDLVIIGAFFGKGRRAGKYGTFVLASYDRESNIFRSVTKIGTGFTDEDLIAFPKILSPFRIPKKHNKVDSKIEADVWFEPHFVLEIVASEVTLSPIHTTGWGSIRKGSGLALRFPKYVGRLRKDKAPEDATTVNEILKIYKSQLKKIRKIR